VKYREKRDMQKIFDFDSNKNTENTQPDILSASSSKNELKIGELKAVSTSSLRSLTNNPKWSVVEPPRLVKSNMSLVANSSNLSTNSLRPSKNNTISQINTVSKNDSISKSLVKRKLKTFDDVEIIMNDDQLVDFSRIMNKAFKKAVKFRMNKNNSFCK